MDTNPIDNRGIFTSRTNFEHRYIPGQKRLSDVVEACKVVGLKVVLTMGTFDIIHIGHFLYLEKAKSLGDILVVGVDSDGKVKARKGTSRPIVPEDERIQMLTQVRHVDIVTLKSQTDPKWSLIGLAKPDVLVISENTYKPADIEKLKQLCGKVVQLAPQATTSTTAKLRRIHISLAQKMKSSITEAVEQAFKQAAEEYGQ